MSLLVAKIRYCIMDVLLDRSRTLHVEGSYLTSSYSVYSVAGIVGRVFSKVVWCEVFGIARRPGCWDVSYL